MASTGYVFKARRYKGSAEPPATVLEDESRYGSDGAFQASGHPDWVQLPSGLWVLDFDSGTPDYVTILNAENQLDFTNEDFSGVAWIHSTSLVASNMVFCRGRANVNGWYWEISAAGRNSFSTNGAGIIQTYSAASQIVVGTWYLVGFSRDGAAVKVYRNGVDHTDTAGTHADPITSGYNATVGIYYDLTTTPFEGKMPPPRFSKRALSAGEHKQIFEAERHWFGI